MTWEEKKKNKVVQPPKKIVVLTLSVEETPKTEAELAKEAEEKKDEAVKLPG